MIATSSANATDVTGYNRWSPTSDEKSPSLNGTGRGPMKRKYRHRPKHDPNAPERPYSAYVMFSNHMRDELKDQDLTFTAISRIVGTGWQSLERNDKEAWQSQATALMTKYKVRLTDYHQTESYRRHKMYVSAFKSTQEAKENDRKHARTSSMTKPGSPTLRLQGSESSLGSPRISRFDPFTPSLPVGALTSGNSMQSKTISSDLSSGRTRLNLSSTSSLSLGVDQEVQRREDSAKIEKYEVLLGKLWPNADHNDRTAIQQGLTMSAYQIHERFGETTISDRQFSPPIDDSGGGRSTISPMGPLNQEEGQDEDAFLPMQGLRSPCRHASLSTTASWYGQGRNNVRSASSEEINFDNPTFPEVFSMQPADPVALPIMARGTSAVGWNSFVNDQSPLSYQDHFDQYDMPAKASIAEYNQGAFCSSSQTPHLFPTASDIARTGGGPSLEEDYMLT